MHGQKSAAQHQDERHTNRLPTPEARREYADALSERMDLAARALQGMADRLRTNPEEMLRYAFVPNIVGMSQAASAEFEVSCLDMVSDVKFVAVKGKMRAGESPMNEVGIRLVWKETDDVTITVTRDNSFGC